MTFPLALLVGLLLVAVYIIIKRQRYTVSQAGRFERARQALAGASLAPMQALADEGLGDAWEALAGYHAQQKDDAHAQRLATDLYRQAAESCTWLPPSRQYDPQASCRNIHETRTFLGLGSTIDYLALKESWEKGYRRGYEREEELAWLHTLGPAELRDDLKAYAWVALRMARWGERAPRELPTYDFVYIKEMLEARLGAKKQEAIRKDAEYEAYREFIEGK